MRRFGGNCKSRSITGRVMLVYKVMREGEQSSLDRDGVFAGSADDRRDGFIHLSTAEQLAATLDRHFAGETGLWLATLDTHALGAALKWEPSRGGALFPHLYRPIERRDVVATALIPASAAIG